MVSDANSPQRTASLALLAVAFVAAFGVLLLVPLWAQLGVLEAGGHDDHAAGSADHEAFLDQVAAQTESYGLPDGSVRIPAGQTVYIQARQFGFSPATIRLRRGERYTLAFHATDMMHGVSLIMNGSLGTVLMPNATVELPIRALESGEVQMVCTEYCGLGHHLMVGRLVIED